jgi:anti-sigma regulatory factor (Ser/Thr protein kinase)
MPGVVELEIPSRPDYLAVARLVVTASAATEESFDDDRLADLRLVVSEVCTNAMEANWVAAGVRPPLAADDPAWADVSTVWLRCIAEPGRVEVYVADHGRGFDPDSLGVHPPVTDPARLDYERGLGIPLIRILADEVDFITTPSGTLVHVVLDAD